MSTATKRTNWLTVKFGDVVKNVAETCRDTQAEGLERYLGLDHFDGGELKIRRWGDLGEDEVSFTRRFRKGQVLFAKRRAYQRKVAVAEFDGICSSDILCFEPKDPKTLLPELLPFLCQTDAFFDHALGTSAGSLSPRTRWSQLKTFEFPLPPLAEQKRLAKLLWAAEEASESWRSVEDEIVRAKRVLEAQFFQLREVHESPKKLPKDYDLGFISDLADIDPRQPPNIASEATVSFIAMEDVAEGGGVLNMTDRSYSEVCKGYTYFGEGDIAFAKITPCMENGKGAIFEGLTNSIGFGSTEFFIFRPKQESDRYFIYYLTMSHGFRERAAHWMRGSAGQQRVPKDFFLQRPIAIPDSDLRKKIGGILDRTECDQRKACAQASKANAVKCALLNSVFARGDRS